MIRIDYLSRLIQSSDFVTFRDIAVFALNLQGYEFPALTDGWKDGGTDVRIGMLPPKKSNLAIQISVEKNWKSKMQGDAKKVKSKLGLNSMVAISSRRMEEREFNKLQNDIFNSDGIFITKLDCQGIASLFFEKNKVKELFDIIGMDLSLYLNKSKVHKFSPKANASLSFLFFSNVSSEFKTEVIESTILSVIGEDNDGLEKQTIINNTAAILSTSSLSDKNVISSAIDRMRHKGTLIGKGSKITLSDIYSQQYQTLIALRNKEFDELQDFIITKINASCKAKITKDISESFIEALGAFLVATSLSSSAQIKHEWENNPSYLNLLKERVKTLYRILDDAGFPEGQERKNFLEDLTTTYSKTELAQQLMAGELFLSLSNLSSSHLIKAFGGHSAIQSILDASVAIPILCTHLFGTTNDKVSFFSSELYEKLRKHGVQIILPEDYLQEIATHCIQAYRNYNLIIDEDPDLASSENAFVSHYVSLKNSGSKIAFSDYLSEFGFSRKYQTMDLVTDDSFFYARDLILPHLERHFESFGINIEALNNISSVSRKVAETEVSQAINEMGIKRSRVLVEHDTKTIGFLIEHSKNPDLLFVFITWDRLHFRVRSMVESYWEAIDPSVFIDILSLCRPEDEIKPLSSPLSFIKTFNEESTRNAASIWDTIAKFDEAGMTNAQLINEAKKFKQDYLTNSHASFDKNEIVKSWTNWKSKYLDRTS